MRDQLPGFSNKDHFLRTFLQCILNRISYELASVVLGHFWFPMVSCCEADSVAFYFSVAILIHIGGKSAFLFSGYLLFTNSQPEYASTTNARNEQWTGARKQPDLHDQYAWKPSLHDQWHDPCLQWKSGTAVCAEPQWPIHGQCSSLFCVCVCCTYCFTDIISETEGDPECLSRINK